MDSLTLIGTAIALGMDAFAVAAVVCAGLCVHTARHTFRLAWHFGLFQFLMTVIGWFGGAGLAIYTHGLNYWIAFGLLTLLGGNMLRQSRHPETRTEGYDPTRGWSLVGLSVATSIDALAVGVSFSLIGMDIWSPAAVIGLAALLMTFIGTRLGKHAGTYFGGWAERIGGIVLIAIGVRILLQYLTQT